MTKHQYSIPLYAALVALSCLFSSCFKEEPLNSECDIEQVSVTVENPEEFFFNVTDATQDVLSDQTNVVFNVRSKADLTAIAPVFKITAGATINPASGTAHDFSDGKTVKYTVTSEDGKWHRDYSLSFRQVVVERQDTIKIDFEDYEKHEKYNFMIWHNPLEGGLLGEDFATGNAGYFYSGMTRPAEDYPTYPIANGYDGACIRLRTCDTGQFGKIKGMPIAAGNFFVGEFDMLKALTQPLMSTRFGKPFPYKPYKFTGYYHYKPGTQYKDKDFNVIERTDSAAIYSVMYKNHDENGNPVMLYGDDVLTNPYIVAKAVAKNVYPVDEWTEFEAFYEFYEELDEELLADHGYSLTIVFSSSYEGAMFLGALDSELWIDKVRLITINKE